MSDKEIVTPGDGQSVTELAQALIRLAEHPHDVEWSPRAGGFVVPLALAAAYAEEIGATMPAADDSKVADEPASKKRRSAAPGSRRRSGRKAADVKGKEGGSDG